MLMGVCLSALIENVLVYIGVDGTGFGRMMTSSINDVARNHGSRKGIDI
jgi:hypothetical protein